MPDSPDFETIAARLVDGLRTAAAAAAAWTRPERPPDTAAPAVVVDALRQVWNARGAADLAIKRRWAIDQEAAIRALDR